MGEPLSCRLCGVTCLFFVFFFSVVQGRDTIRPGESLNDTETLVSAAGIFELGFFTAAEVRGRYLGIWYHSVSPRIVVWVANRLRPVPDDSGVLRLSEDGVLTVIGKSLVVFFSSAKNGSHTRPIARLLDSGNFVVGGESSVVSGGSYDWQSFDQPYDTLLPGMQVGLDRRTGLQRNVTGSRSAGNPSPGNFTYIIDPRGVPQLAMVEGSKMRWRAGPWTGERFVGIPGMGANSYFFYGFVSDADQISFIFYDKKISFLSRIVVNETGGLQHYAWFQSAVRWQLVWESPFGFCDRMAACGANAICDSVTSPPKCNCLDGFQRVEGGCARAEGPGDCRSIPGSMVKVSSVKWPDTSSATVNKSMGLDECKAACLRNCSCTAAAVSDRSGCVSWFGDLLDIMLFPNGGGQDLYVRGPARNKDGWRRMTAIMGGTVVCLTAVIALLARLWRVRHRRARRIHLSVTTKSALNLEADSEKEFDLPQFQLPAIVAATGNFSLQNKLGQGGFGPVYRGTLSDGQTVAAKRLSANSRGQGLEEFKSEIKLLASLQHTNLVRLLGFCTSEEEKILVYEYMPNQSLDKFIFDPKKGAELDWTKRANVVEGIAQGLLYLHRYSRVTAIHRDLKASNILLDGDWNPKISDFGLARIFTRNEALSETRRIVGTYGYIPPECAMRGHFSVKSDVFSYGILLLEILSGRRNTCNIELDESLNISGYAWKLWGMDNVLELMDPVLTGTCPSNEFSRCIHVALLCVQENADDRPTMFDVVSMLNNESIPLPAPNRPAYLLERLVLGEDGQRLDRVQYSCMNDVTYSEVDGR